MKFIELKTYFLDKVGAIVDLLVRVMDTPVEPGVLWNVEINYTGEFAKKYFLDQFFLNQ